MINTAKVVELQFLVNESRHALRVNGKVTLAKRHLHSVLPKCDNVQQALFRFLTIVPFLHDKGDGLGLKDESQKYCLAKAKALYKALGLQDEIIPAFMMVCLNKAGDIDDDMALRLARHSGYHVIEADDPDFLDGVPEEDKEVVSEIVGHLRGEKRTLH